VAVSACLFCVGAAVYVLLPYALVLDFRGSVITELDAQLGGGLDAAYDAVTEWLEEFHEENRDKLATLGRWFTASCAALAGLAGQGREVGGEAGVGNRSGFHPGDLDAFAAGEARNRAEHR
jgi:hypothetical protein